LALKVASKEVHMETIKSFVSGQARKIYLKENPINDDKTEIRKILRTSSFEGTADYCI
jgi:hypothetical protein